MKKLIVVACLVLGAGILVACELGANGEKGIVATAVAQDAAKGCSNIGSWVTDTTAFAETDPNPSPPWISMATGLSASAGTIVTDVPHWPNVTVVNPATGEPIFATAVRVTELKGVWERAGGSTFAFTQVGWGVDAKGDVLYVVRNSGSTTLTDCNTELVKSTMEWFFPGEEKPFITVVLPDFIGHRIMVSPPNPPLD